jgi:hypothetical protein
MEGPLCKLLISSRSVNKHGRHRQLLYTEPSIGASYQIADHMATRFQRRRFFRNQPIRNKNCLWRPCLLTDRDEMVGSDKRCNKCQVLSSSIVPVYCHRPLSPSIVIVHCPRLLSSSIIPIYFHRLLSSSIVSVYTKYKQITRGSVGLCLSPFILF